MSDAKQPLLNQTPPAYGAPPPGYGGPPPPPPGYAVPQQGYPSQGYTPQPGYAAVPPPPRPGQQQATHVVVGTQPQHTHVVYERHYGSGDHYLLMSVILSFLCFFCGTWWALVCTIPAIFFAINAQESESRGDVDGARRSTQLALILNIVGIVTYVVTWVIIIIAVVVVSTSNTYVYSY